MSVFFDHRAATNANSVHTEIAWHPTFALLAVATKIDDAENESQGAVNLFFDEVPHLLVYDLSNTRVNFLPYSSRNLIFCAKVYHFIVFRGSQWRIPIFRRTVLPPSWPGTLAERS